MLRHQKPFWLVLAAIGALSALGAVISLIVRLAQGTAALLPVTVLVLMILGGGLLVFFALRTLKILPNADESPLNRSFSRSISAVILLLAAVVFLWAYGEAQQVESIPQSAIVTGVQYETGKVISIDEDNSIYRGEQTMEDMPIGSQYVYVEIDSGEFAGKRYYLKNNLAAFYGTILEVGDSVTVSFSLTEGELDDIQLQDYNRTSPLLWIVLAFILVTALVGGKVGAKSLLGLGLTILCIFTILIPLLLQGWPTIPTILGMCAFVTVVEFTILGGVSKKITCAILGTISGVVIAALFGELACSVLRINGYRMYETESAVEALLLIKQTQDPMHSLQIGDLLVGGILIAALGAVNDVAMSISSAMNELITVNPNLSRKELFKSGMNIGRDMVGTMTNTLILAFVGGGLIMIIYLTSLEPTLNQLMSTPYLAVEVVQGIASSIGVILAVPLSVVIGMTLFAHPHKKAVAKKA